MAPTTLTSHDRVYPPLMYMRGVRVRVRGQLRVQFVLIRRWGCCRLLCLFRGLFAFCFLVGFVLFVPFVLVLVLVLFFLLLCRLFILPRPLLPSSLPPRPPALPHPTHTCMLFTQPFRQKGLERVEGAQQSLFSSGVVGVVGADCSHLKFVCKG